MLRKINFSDASTIVGFSLVVWPQLTFAVPNTLELRAKQFFPVGLDAGQQLGYEKKFSSLPRQDETSVEWVWNGRELFMKCSVGDVSVSPLEGLPSEAMTEEMVISARALHGNVPFIKNFLEGNENPSNWEWAVAYHGWLDARVELSTRLKSQFKHDRRNVAQVAADLVKQANRDELVVPGSARADLGAEGNQIDIIMVLRGGETSTA